MGGYLLPRGAPRMRESAQGLEKFCAYCGKWKLADLYTWHREGVGGLDNRCNGCRNDRRRQATARRLRAL